MSKTFAESWKEAPRGTRIGMTGFFIALFGAMLGFGLLSVELKVAAILGYLIVAAGVAIGIVGVIVGFYDFLVKMLKHTAK